MAKLASAQAQNFSIPHFVCCVNVFSLFAINLRTAIEQRILVMPTYPILTNFTPYLCIFKVLSLLLLVNDVGLKIFYTERSPLTNAFNSKFNTVRKIVLKLLLYLYFRTKVLKFRHDILIK